jgi:uncharacterized protein YkwD
MNILFIMIRDLPKLTFLFFAFVAPHSSFPAIPSAAQTIVPKEPVSLIDSRLPGNIRTMPASMEADILTYVNEDRKQHGLAALKLSDVESAIAAKHSRDMASGRVAFGHSGLDARAKAIRKALGEISSIGENVASGPMNAREVVDGWLNSPGHKRNIEGDFTLTGIGYAQDTKGNIFFTQIFSK